jgi:hypothetical protein
MKFSQILLLLTELIFSQNKGKETGGACITQIRNNAFTGLNLKGRCYLRELGIDYKTI